MISRENTVFLNWLPQIFNTCILGTLFAGMGMIDSFITIVGTTVSSAVYSATVTYFRGFVFLMFAGISCVAVILIM